MLFQMALPCTALCQTTTPRAPVMNVEDPEQIDRATMKEPREKSTGTCSVLTQCFVTSEYGCHGTIRSHTASSVGTPALFRSRHANCV